MAQGNRELLRFPDQQTAYLKALERRIAALEAEMKKLKAQQNVK